MESLYERVINILKNSIKINKNGEISRKGKQLDFNDTCLKNGILLDIDTSSAKNMGISLWGDAELRIYKADKKKKKNPYFTQKKFSPHNFEEFISQIILTLYSTDWDKSENKYDSWKSILNTLGKNITENHAKLEGMPVNSILLINDGNRRIILAEDKDSFYYFQMDTS